MKDTARIITVGTEEILVEPLLKDTCINCAKSSCAKKGKPFAVSNPRRFTLYPGAIVRVSASIRYQGFQAAFSLILPLLAGLFGYYVPQFIWEQPGEPVRVAGVFVFFGLAAALVLWISRRSPFGRRLAEISEILTNSPAQAD